MNTPITTTNPPDDTAAADRLARLSTLMRGYEDTRRALFRLPHNGNVANADRAARLALVSARITGVWRLIVAYGIDNSTVPAVYRHAAVLAECDARNTARFWRDIAADWQARAEQRPTSDAAGSLSNWHELGVTA